MIWRHSMRHCTCILTALIFIACSENAAEISAHDGSEVSMRDASQVSADTAQSSTDAVDIPSVSPAGPDQCPRGGMPAPFGWCWSTPLPHGYQITKVASPAPGVLWLIGRDFLLRRDADGWHTAWHRTLSTSGEEVYRFHPDEIASAEADTVFAIEASGRRLVRHRHHGITLAMEAPCEIGGIEVGDAGVTWLMCEPSDAGTAFFRLSWDDDLHQLDLPVGEEVEIVDFQPSPGGGLVVLTATALLQSDGAGWSTRSLVGAPLSPRTRGVALTVAGEDIFVLTSTRQVLRWRSGNLVSVREVPPTLRIVEDRTDIGANGPDDVWLWGDGAFHWTDGAWRRVVDERRFVQDLDVRAHAVHMVAREQLYEIVDDRPVALLPERVRVNDLWAGPNGQVAIVGSRGLVARWNGTGWARERVAPAFDVRHVTGATLSDLWVLGRHGTIYHLEAGEWVRIDHELAADAGVFDIAYDVSRDAIWLASTAGLLRREATGTWRSFSAPGVLQSPEIVAITSDGAVWAANEDGAARFMDGTWSLPRGAQENEVDLESGTIHDLWADGNDVWIAVSNRVAHWDGAAWSTTSFAGADIGAVAAHASDAVVVGEEGFVRRFDGREWTPVDLGTGATMREVAVRDGLAWVATDEGIVFAIERDGTVEKHVLSPPWESRFHAMRTDGAGRRWFILDGGHWAHWQNGAWIDHGILPHPDRLDPRAFGGLIDQPVLIGERRSYHHQDERWNDRLIGHRVLRADVSRAGHAVVGSHVYDVDTSSVDYEVAWLDGAGWSRTRLDGHDDVDDVAALAVSGARTGWLVTHEPNRLLRFDGDRWQSADTGIFTEIKGLWPLDEKTVWFWTDDRFWTWDGERLTRHGLRPCKERIRAIDGTGPDDVWLTCDDGVFSGGAGEPWRRERRLGVLDIHVTASLVTVLTPNGVLVKERAP